MTGLVDHALFGLLALCLGLLSWPLSAAEPDAAFASAEVAEFTSARYEYPPSPFKIKQAQKLGIPVEVREEPSVALTGFLARPAGDDRHPAVVLMHSCAGISGHEESWSKKLVEWGYVVLTVDSFNPRGFDYICDGRPGTLVTPWQRALDAYGARSYLETLDYVDAKRVAVMGMSHGGMTVMEAIKLSLTDGGEMEPFQAAIAFYPLCSEPEPVNTPTLVMVGSADSWTPATLCEEYLVKSPSPRLLTLRVFDGAYHLFDHPGIDEVELGFVIRSDPEAAAEADTLAQGFLKEHLQSP